MKKVVVIGAGPGGLSAAMMLAHQGFDVHIYERLDRVGGRNRCLELGAYQFDVGPTFWSMVHLAEEQFASIGKRLTDYLTLTDLTHMYDLYFANDKKLMVTRNHEEMKERIARQFPGNEQGYLNFLVENRARMEALTPILRQPMQSLRAYFRPEVIKALPKLKLTSNLASELARWFPSEDLQLAFGFQSKYLGMSPESCPGAFSILAFMEHEYGIMHVKGGLNQLSQALAKVVEEGTGQIHFNQSVERIIVENQQAVGIELANGEVIKADYVIVNEDFAHAMNHLFEPGILKKYTPEKLAKRKYSCSTLMFYLGLDTKFADIAHHNIIFSDDYHQSLQEIFGNYDLPQSPSIYVQNASVTDDTLAPPGHSTLYILAPMPNNEGEADWSEAQIAKYREWIFARIEAKLGCQFQSHIQAEFVITPQDWETKERVYKGAVFNLSHQLSQMMTFRPHNQFEEVERVYLVGGGTHPGSGLPTILESGRMSAALIRQQAGSE
ncbi:MAG: phytoene desaturase family protein [Culicoidibacterales bacterium]